MFIATVMLLGILAAVVTPVDAEIVRPFSIAYESTARGGLAFTGNSLLTCPATATNCTGFQDGSLATGGSNNQFAMLPIDVDADPSTASSSFGTLPLSGTADVRYAILVWGAQTTAGQGGIAASGTRNQITFTTPAGTQSTITADRFDERAGQGTPYQGAAEVTDLVRASGPGEYGVANIAAATGIDRFAGWGLVVAFEDPGAPMNSVVIYDGFAAVQQSDPAVSLAIDGFAIPPDGGQVVLGFLSYEGDRTAFGDTFTLNGTAMTNALNPVNNVANSTISRQGVVDLARRPAFQNTLGFDLDAYNATGVLAPGQTSTTLDLATNLDNWYPGLVALVIETVAPELVAPSTSKVVVDLNGGSTVPGDVVEYRMTLTNAGDAAATELVLVDPLPAGLAAEAGSLRIDGVTSTDAAGDDAGDLDVGAAVVTARLGNGADASSGGTLAPGATTEVAVRATVLESAIGSTLNNLGTATYSSDLLDTTFTSDVGPAALEVVAAPVTTTTTSTTSTTSTSVAGSPPTGAAAAGTGQRPRSRALSTGDPRTLATTGSGSTIPMVVGGVLAVLLGAAVVLVVGVSRRRDDRGPARS